MSSTNNNFNPIEGSRLVIAISIAVVLSIIFASRLFDLQIVQGLVFSMKAERISQQQSEIPAQRGKIYDRNGELLATNMDLFAISITPSDIPRDQVASVLERLRDNFGISQSIIDRRVPPSYYRSYLTIELKSGFDLPAISYLAENIGDYPGVSWSSKPRRIYTKEGTIGTGATVGHVLGYVGDITAEELQTLYNQGYRRGDILGKSGIEKQYDFALRGKPGTRYTIVDATGRRVQDADRKPIDPVNGEDIYLTIDMKIQRLAEEALGDRRGSVIVMKAVTGEVLAMVSNPVFNANLFDKGGRTSFAMQSIDPNFPFINRAISAEYPAASPFKVVTETAILKNKTVDPRKEVLCTGSILIGDRVFRCHNRAGHGWQNLSDALANSCNIYFATIAKDFLAKDENGQPDPEKLTEQALDFGYGSLTEIDIPNEKEGLIPSKQWKEEIFHDGWRGGDTVNMSIGQGWVLTTPLQAANAMALAANRGTTYKPHLLKSIVNPETNEIIEEAETQVLHTSSVDSEVWEQLNHDLREVTLRGTGWMLNRITTMAGKTGTGEVGVDGSYHDWYIGYAPYTTPVNPQDRIIVMVQIESSNVYQWWSTKAADMIVQGVFAGQDYKEVLNTLRPWYINWRAITGAPYPVFQPAAEENKDE